LKGPSVETHLSILKVVLERESYEGIVMKLLEKILVAIDFSQPSKDALRMAILLARAFRSEVVLIHIIPEITGLKIDRGKMRKIETDKLREMEMGLQRGGIIVPEVILRFGTPFERIIEHSDELDVSLIVVGSGKREKKFPLGITAERIIVHADKPVLVVKPGSPPDIRKILCPVDFSEPSRRALNNAIHLSRTLEAHLTVLTVFEPLLSGYFGPGSTPGVSREKDLVKRQRHQYDRFLRGFKSEDLNWTKTIRRGKPHEEILKMVRETHPDLLVMGSQGRTGFSRLLMGSTTEKVVREVPCSVMTLKQEHVIRFPLEKELTDIETHFRRGKELLQKKMMESAIAQFEYCIRRDTLFIPAWEEMAEAYRYTGKKKEAHKCEEMAAHIRKHLRENQKEHMQE
jgi:nucleotide-binding universal stress UspA family protein